jgi:hypothetical protein
VTSEDAEAVQNDEVGPNDEKECEELCLRDASADLPGFIACPSRAHACDVATITADAATQAFPHVVS